MDDLKFGTRNKKGDWSPANAPQIPFFWSRPFDLVAWVKFLFGYIWPWNTFHMAVTLFYWRYVLPDWETMKTFAWGWALWLYAVNAVGIFLMYGAVEFFYYWKRKQGARFKYNGKFPSEQPSDVFWFRSQNIDNFLRSYLISIPLWTAIEVFMLWCFANGHVAWVGWADHPYYLAVLVLLAPIIHEVHFFCIHRLIHTPFLYKWVHSVHHNSVNPSPWSSLSMHPVEAFAYHAVALWHLVIPSNPFVALFQLHLAGYGALNGHIGFEKLELAGEATLDSHAYLHWNLTF